MLKKDITYTDFDGNEVTESYYFHYTVAETAELEASQSGGLSAAIEKIIAESDIKKILDLFKQIIGGAVGQRSEDGKRFVKSDEYTQEFLQSEAYSELFLELIQNPEYAAEFVRGLVPQKIQQANAAQPSNPNVAEPAWLREGRPPSTDELRAATPDQIQKAFQLKQQNRS